MALTEAEKLNIAKILRVTYIDVNDQITNLGSTYITAAVETQIQAELTRWETAGVNFTAIEPKEANFGAKIDPNSAKADIRANLAALLYMTDMIAASSQSRLTRG